MVKENNGAAAAGAAGLIVPLEGFVDYLREQRGASPLTIAAYVSDVGRFLVGRGGGDLRELSAAEVSKAVLGETADWSPASVRRYACALRSFLRYCEVAGLIETDLSAAVLPVSGRRRSLLPQGISEAQAKALLQACDRRRAVGRRDYAVIVLLLRLGLRAGEVARLRLEDLDWRAGQVTVHGKGRRVDQLPLPVDIGEAITAYLRRGRPRVEVREVFLRVAPPPVGLTRSGISTIVRHASVHAGLTPFGAHRLRHTAATDMLRAGAPLVEIGQVLRHRSAGSTAAYARVDVERLRTIARPWPGGAAS